MKADKTTKLLLALIAMGLWLNAIAPLWHPVPAAAATPGPDIEQIENDVHEMADNVRSIAHGLCTGAVCKDK